MISHRSRIQNGVLAGILLLVFFTQAPAQAESEPKVRISRGQTVYVPVYSHIYSGDREQPFLLAVTLSIRNTDLKQPIILVAADYMDSNGKLLKKFIEEPFRLNPLSATRYVIKESDKSGGSGASFILKWKADGQVTPPIMESIMIGTQIQQGISFTSRGQVLRED